MKQNKKPKTKQNKTKLVGQKKQINQTKAQCRIKFSGARGRSPKLCPFQKLEESERQKHMFGAYDQSFTSEFAKEGYSIPLANIVSNIRIK